MKFGVYTIEFYSTTMKNEILFSQENGWNWKSHNGLEKQTLKDKYCVLSLTSGIGILIPMVTIFGDWGM